MREAPLIKYRYNDSQLTDEQFAKWLATLPASDVPILMYLDGNQLTHVAMKTLADNPGMRLLTALSLAGNPIGDQGLGILARGPIFAYLESLVAPSCGITAAGAAIVVGPDSVYGMRTLDLSDNPLGDEGVEALAQSPYASYMRSLYLGDVGATDRGAKALADSPHLANLSYLVLTGNGFTQEGKDALSASPHLAGCTIEFGE